MRISILLLVFLTILFSCKKLSNNQTQVYSTEDGEFIVDIDTLNIDLKQYVNTDTVTISHAVKFRETYYCFFRDKKESYSKYFFVISNKGTIEKEIKLPKDLSCIYLDLFVFHDTIFSKPYNGQCYYLDLQTLNWVETTEPDDVIYEDERFYVTNIDFGEWGSTTWFKEKLSGKEYVLSSPSNDIDLIDSVYYISGSLRVLKIENPVNMKQCDKEYYYQIIKKKEYSEGINSLLGTEIVFEDTTYSEWDWIEPKKYIVTSFKVKNRLFYLCNDSLKTFVAKLENKELIPILSLKRKYSIFKWHYSYRCKTQNDNFQLLNFCNETDNTNGFVEIKENKIKIRYLNLKNN